MDGAAFPIMPEARIGPNAITQLVAILDQVEGRRQQHGKGPPGAARLGRGGGGGAQGAVQNVVAA